ncbi:hypothetical protein ACFPZL_01155 [Leucobacter soli]|uniref:hypothetical protein n=1 Tax=Leucobacter soli TaxID=2812850 RepID=UPI001C404F00|nr:hypothetical protein [Leucobacter soli]
MILATKNVDRELRAQIRKHTRQMILPEWQRATAEHAATRLEHRVLAQTARAAVSDQNVTLKAAQIGRALQGGLKPSELWWAVEFGADGKRLDYTGRRGSRTFPVKNRRTTQQLRPRNQRGYVFHPAAAAIIPRLASLWTQTAARTIHEAFEGK